MAVAFPSATLGTFRTALTATAFVNFDLAADVSLPSDVFALVPSMGNHHSYHLNRFSDSVLNPNVAGASTYVDIALILMGDDTGTVPYSMSTANTKYRISDEFYFGQNEIPYRNICVSYLGNSGTVLSDTTTTKSNVFLLSADAETRIPVSRRGNNTQYTFIFPATNYTFGTSITDRLKNTYGYSTASTSTAMQSVTKATGTGKYRFVTNVQHTKPGADRNLAFGVESGLIDSNLTVNYRINGSTTQIPASVKIYFNEYPATGDYISYILDFGADISSLISGTNTITLNITPEAPPSPSPSTPGFIPLKEEKWEPWVVALIFISVVIVILGIGLLLFFILRRTPETMNSSSGAAMAGGGGMADAGYAQPCMAARRVVVAQQPPSVFSSSC